MSISRLELCSIELIFRTGSLSGVSTKMCNWTTPYPRIFVEPTGSLAITPFIDFQILHSTVGKLLRDWLMVRSVSGCGNKQVSLMTEAAIFHSVALIWTVVPQSKMWSL